MPSDIDLGNDAAFHLILKRAIASAAGYEYAVALGEGALKPEVYNSTTPVYNDACGCEPAQSSSNPLPEAADLLCPLSLDGCGDR